MKNSPTCVLCDSEEIFEFFEFPPVPTQDGRMCDTQESAESVVKGAIDLHFCKKCGFILNEGYDAEKISFDEYDFSNDHSPIFQAYVKDLSNRLFKKYDLKNKTILEIGSGNGIFLKTICELGDNKGIGMDPGFDLNKVAVSETADLQFIREYYSAKNKDLKPDFVICRLVLDLLDDQTSFLKMLRKNLDQFPQTIVYFEVPNASYTFEDRVFWNVVYEHRAWYTEASLAFQFSLCGFEVLNIAPCWKDEFLGIEVKTKPLDHPVHFPDPEKINLLSDSISAFNADFKKLKARCEIKIEDIKKNGIKTIAWSAGARAVSFFNLFDLKKEVPYIIDINSHRHGKYLPGSAQEIVAPEFISTYHPDLVIITNPTYANEIKEQIAGFGLNPEIWVL